MQARPRDAHVPLARRKVQWRRSLDRLIRINAAHGGVSQDHLQMIPRTGSTTKAAFPVCIFQSLLKATLLRATAPHSSCCLKRRARPGQLILKGDQHHGIRWHQESALLRSLVMSDCSQMSMTRQLLRSTARRLAS